MKTSTKMKPLIVTAAATLFGASAVVSASAAAQDLSDEWRFRALVYFWAAQIKGGATFPGGNTADFDFKFHTIFDNLKMAGMGSIEAQKGSWGVFTDVLYMNVGATDTRTRDGTIDGVPLPVGVTANAGVGIKAWVWTLAASYRVQSSDNLEMDVFAGARLLWLQPLLTYNFNVDVGPFTGPARVGSRSVTEQNWDGIVGVKGRLGIGTGREWFIPYYLDVGTGDSDLTWQGAVGIGYAFSWGEVIATWRYLDYNFKSSAKVNDLKMTGPLLGVAFRW